MKTPAAMPSKSLILSQLFALYQEAGISYCLLRNYENLPLSVDARDVDILVLRSQREANRKVVKALVQDGAAMIYHYFGDERFDQYYLLLRNGLDGEVQELKLDFFFDSELYGVRLIAGADILATRRPYRNFFVAEPLYTFLDKWLFGYLLGAALPLRYHEEFRQACVQERDRAYVILESLLGAARAAMLVDQICEQGFTGKFERLSKPWLLLVLVKHAARSWGFHAQHLPHFFFSRLRHTLRPKGEFISLSGPDGSGKTTVLAGAGAQLRILFPYSAASSGHFRPSTLPRIAFLLKAGGVVKTVDEQYAAPHRCTPSGSIGSLARFSYYCLDYLWGYFIKIRPALVRRELVIYDRYFFDMVADQGRSRIKLPPWIRKLGLSILPLPHTAFFVHVSPEVVRERKQELPLERIVEINTAYLELATSGHMVILENEGSPAAAISALVGHVVNRRRVRLGLDRG